MSPAGEVTVGVDQNEAVRAPGTPGRFGQLSMPQGRSPGTPARPINLDGSASEAESILTPFDDVHSGPPGARSKAKASPARHDGDARVEYVGSLDSTARGSNDPMPFPPPMPVAKQRAVRRVAPPAPKGPPPPPVAQNVWIAPNQGKKFHRGTCTKAMYMSAELVSISRDDAMARGYGACKVCRP